MLFLPSFGVGETIREGWRLIFGVVGWGVTIGSGVTFRWGVTMGWGVTIDVSNAIFFVDWR